MEVLADKIGTRSKSLLDTPHVMVEVTRADGYGAFEVFATAAARKDAFNVDVLDTDQVLERYQELSKNMLAGSYRIRIGPCGSYSNDRLRTYALDLSDVNMKGTLDRMKQFCTPNHTG